MIPRAWALGSALVLAACGGDKPEMVAIPPPRIDSAAAGPAEGGRVLAVNQGAFRMTFALENAVVTAGEPIVADVAISNRFGRPARIVFPSSSRFDLIVSSDPEGDFPVTGWSWGESSQPVVADLQLKATDVIARRLELPTGAADQAPPGRAPFVPPGRFFIRALSMSEPFMRTPTVGIEVKERPAPSDDAAPESPEGGAGALTAESPAPGP